MITTFGTYTKDIATGILFAGTIIVVQTWLMGSAILFLDIGWVITLCIWAVQTMNMDAPDVTRLYFIAVGIQCFHFLEYFTGFQVNFPRFFGYAWSDQQFIAFNIIWIGIFILNGVWLYSRTRLSYLLVYFLAIVGGIANGIAHPLLSLNEGGYFPGLITSPFVLIVGISLLTRLMKSR